MGLPWYAPWSAFVWQERFGTSDTYGLIDQAIAHSQPLFLLPQFVIIGVWLCFQKKLRSNANLNGSARWAEEREIRTKAASRIPFMRRVLRRGMPQRQLPP